MRGSKRKPRSQSDVELNMAAMLDMAFQLLAFFILTFRPSPVESPMALRMPQPAPLPHADGPPSLAPTLAPTEPPAREPEENLIVVLQPTSGGNIDRIVIGERVISANGSPKE